MKRRLAHDKVQPLGPLLPVSDMYKRARVDLVPHGAIRRFGVCAS